MYLIVLRELLRFQLLVLPGAIILLAANDCNVKCIVLPYFTWLLYLVF